MGLLVTTLAADDKYPVPNRENSTMPKQMQLSQKEKTFSNVFDTFSKSRLNFDPFEEKGDTHRVCISEMTGFENVLR